MPCDGFEEALGGNNDVVGVDISYFLTHGFVYHSNFGKTIQNEPQFFLGIEMLIFSSAGYLIFEKTLPTFENDLDKYVDT